MAEILQGGQIVQPVRSQNQGTLVRAAQVARDADVQQSANGVRWATFGETGVPAPDLDRMLQAVPASIVDSLREQTYFFVPLAMREPEAAAGSTTEPPTGTPPEPAMVAPAYTDEFSDGAICHRNVELDRELGRGHRGVFISTRLMDDRFALSFEFFINVAHALTDAAGVPERFAELAWKQVQDGVRGETSFDAWESRNLALGRPANYQPEPPATPQRRNRTYPALARPFSTALQAAAAPLPVADEKERTAFLEAAFSDAVAVYLLSPGARL